MLQENPEIVNCKPPKTINNPRHFESARPLFPGDGILTVRQYPFIPLGGEGTGTLTVERYIKLIPAEALTPARHSDSASKTSHTFCHVT